MKLTQEEREQLRKTIMDDLLGNEGNEKTPVDKINKRIEVYIEQEEGSEDDQPTTDVPDIDPEDIGEFPNTVH